MEVHSPLQYLVSVNFADNERLLSMIIGIIWCKNEKHSEVISEYRSWQSFPTLEDSLIPLYAKKIGGRICSLYNYD